MKPTSQLLQLLLPLTTLASPAQPNLDPNSRLAARLAARQEAISSEIPQHPQGNPLIPVSAPFPIDAAVNGTYEAQYSSNWAGGVQTSPPAGTHFTSVSASFNVPDPTKPSGAGSGSYAASAWAGIDGDTYVSAPPSPRSSLPLPPRKHDVHGCGSTSTHALPPNP